MKMPRHSFTLLLSLLLAIASNAGWAQAGKELDITLSIVDEQEAPEAIINRIPLPPPTASLPAIESPVDIGSRTTTGIADTPQQAVEQLQEQVQTTTNQILNNTGDVLTNSINDVISSGGLEQLPGDIIDKLPDTLPDDLLPAPIDTIIDDLTNTDSALPSVESAIDGLEQSAPDVELPAPVDNTVIPGPLPLPDTLPLPTDQLIDPLKQ